MGFIRKPFLLRNLAIGIVSGVLANGIMAGSIMLLLRYEPQMSYLFTSSTLSIVGATVMAVGILITWVCAYISINRFLKMKAGDLYYI